MTFKSKNFWLIAVFYAHSSRIIASILETFVRDNRIKTKSIPLEALTDILQFWNDVLEECDMREVNDLNPIEFGETNVKTTSYLLAVDLLARSCNPDSKFGTEAVHATFRKYHSILLKLGTDRDILEEEVNTFLFLIQFHILMASDGEKIDQAPMKQSPILSDAIPKYLM